MNMVIFIVIILLICAVMCCRKQKMYEPTICRFYMPGCGACKQTEHVWHIASQNLEAAGYRIVNIDCTVDREIAAKYNITSVPTIIDAHNRRWTGVDDVNRFTRQWI